MKSIPIWQHKSKTIQPSQQPPIPPQQSQPVPDLTPIFINPIFQIYTSKSPQTPPPTPPPPQQSLTQYTYTNTYTTTSNVNQIDSCKGGGSLIYDKKFGRVVWVQGVVVYGCVGDGEGGYWVVLEDLGGRYEIVRVGELDFVDVLRTIRKSLLHGQQLDSISPNTIPKDTPLKPLRKTTPQFSTHNNNLYLAGNTPIHKWELTSPVWVYVCNDNRWQEVDIDVGRHGMEEKYGYGYEGIRDWVFVVDGFVVIVGEMGVRVVGVNGDYHKQIPLPRQKQTLINTKSDSYLTCTYKNPTTESTNLLLLIQPKSPTRDPLLLQISLTTTTTTTTTSTSTNKLKHKINEDGKMGNKRSSNVNGEKEKDRDREREKEKGGIQVQVSRYDLGVFLGNADGHFGDDRLDRMEKGGLGAGGMAVINQIVYMQVSTVGATSINHSMSTTSHSNFIKKPDPQLLKNPTKKTQILTLYTKTRKSPQTASSTHIQLDTYSIKLPTLQKTDLCSPNRPLSFYFQKKQYSDLIFLAQKHQVLCNRQLFQFYSSKFKKLYSNSSNSRTESQQSQPQQTLVKLDNTKLSTIYFLVQHLYHNFGISLKGFQEGVLVDLMILSHKFQIVQMQVLCQYQVQITCENFNKMYDYFRNAETPRFREQFFKFFIIHAQDVIKIMPIGKVQQLIRLVYSPECAHTTHTEIKCKLDNNYTLRDSDTGQTKQFHKSFNYANIIKSEQMALKICLKCSRLLTFNHETHRKNKSSVRGSSLGSFGHKKKDNKSN